MSLSFLENLRRSRKNFGRFLAFSSVCLSDALITLVYCESPDMEMNFWVKKLMGIFGIEWTLFLLTPLFILGLFVFFSLLSGIEREGETLREKAEGSLGTRLCLSFAFGLNLFGPVSWFFFSGLYPWTTLLLATVTGFFFWFTLGEETVGWFERDVGA